ncbi:MAG: ABC transporter ATP-binding protein [Comamonadaceae bacterium]|nr:MAG: ABC transporter ATP-binding protein [Comamonadaceae bacterium]
MLKLESVSIFYGAIQALNDVSLDVRAGEIVTIIGGNGAGKSTLLKGVAGLEPLKGGRIVFEGTDISTVPAHLRVPMGIAMSPEGRSVFPDQTVHDNLLLGAYSRRHAADETADQVEAQFALFPRLRERRSQYAGTLSGGEQQMLAIARSLMSSPRLLLLDEPSLGLAPMITADIIRTVRRLCDEGLTILLVEQMANQALRIADRACVLDRGRIVLTGTGEDLRRNPQVSAAYLGGH